ncbi:MAG TPA: tRNA (N(6)-L-threonylcarbamoyladenosine(37)-C(2))-methylthiotransferase MtaB [Terriglobales bacterium]|nr:tRNA (N(6)-L-threonylcarbamoyladenosine(37)-C(2))-methylthiotransferase MtaB [Terriglobales bacterium]
MARFYIENFGCRATQADGAALERQFVERGLQRAATSQEAEIVVLNTCTVTEGADKDARASIRRLQRINPDCRILVTGCYAQRAPEELAALPGVTWVVGNSHKHRAAEIATLSSVVPSAPSSSTSGFVPLQQLSGEPNIVVGDIFAHTELLAAPVFEAANERTRPNLKVQDGCDNRCSFCVIPYVRGKSRSLPMERVIQEVRTLVEAGYREVVISGINLGRWGRDLDGSSQLSSVSSRLNPATGSRRLEALVLAILQETSLEKLRISSVEPMDWSDELIELMASSPRIAKHAHVPLQSGSDAVLRRMHRKYRPWHYREKILKIRRAMPTAAIGADVMVGFPGETGAEFEETRRVIEELPFTYLHVFTYSPRPGTPAAAESRQVPVAIARERNRILRELASKKKAAFMQCLVGTAVEAITLQSVGGGFTEALTDNYLKMKILGRHEANQWMKLRVESVPGEMLAGSPTAMQTVNP